MIGRVVMDVVTLSRGQFAVTSIFHFLLVPLTLGLSVLIAWMETRYVQTGDELWLRMTKFWGKLFLINFAVGVVTGLTMEFQFGMNWAEYSRYVGDIFGAPLAIEATLAFFLESVFIGVWVFGWKKVSKRVHVLSIWIVAFATNLSALWILLANGWMQRPVGFVLRNNRAEMTDFGALFGNVYGWVKFLHSVSSGYLVAAFFVMGISAWHLVRKRDGDFFSRSFRTASGFSLLGISIMLFSGAWSAELVARFQPPKLATMESQWETVKGAAYNIVPVPDPAHERNAVEALRVPKLLSVMSFHDPSSVVKGLKEFPKKLRPPFWPVFICFRLMIVLGGGMAFLCGVCFAAVRWGKLEKYPLLLRVMVFAIPVPYVAAESGWVVAEVGRQPWIVYNVLKTSDAVSKSVGATQVFVSLVGFVLLYGLLAMADLYLLTRAASKGPENPENSGLPLSGKGA